VRILVIDDDVELASLLRTFLQREGFTPEFVYDGKAGLERTLQGGYDLIVLDVMLPGLSGIEVLEEIRNDEKLKEMLVVVITAWSHAELDARVAGADRFVSKPFDPDELSNAVEELLG
jgi:DNA-binding response OmpR family regulator